MTAAIRDVFGIVASGVTFFAVLGAAYILALACVGAALKSRRSELSSGPIRNRFLIFIPAHNEEEGIRPTLTSLKTISYPPDLYEVIVVADNCTDRTSEVVRQLGVECWERANLQERGKGQALRWAFDRAAQLNFDAVVVIDADTEVHSNLLAALDRELAAGARAVQVADEFVGATERCVSSSTVSGQNSQSKLFWAPRQRLGLAVFLQGNGFCLKKDVLRDVPWAAYSIVEDIEYSLQLLSRGIRVVFIDDVNVVSRPALSTKAATAQRLRWASGSLQIIWRWVPRLLYAAIRQKSFQLADAAFSLLFSSRMLLLYFTIFASALTFATPSPLSSALRATLAFALVLQVVFAFMVVRFGSAGVFSWKRAALLPGYLAWLFVVQFLALLGLRRNVWSRTVR